MRWACNGLPDNLEDPSRVDAVFTTESRQKRRELFLRTHFPSRRIRVDFCKERRSERVHGRGESDASCTAVPWTRTNRLFFVVGEAGSGKSELCQWLEYTCDLETRVPIHIPRSMTTAAHVAALLRRRFNRTWDDTFPSLKTPIHARARHAAVSAVVLLYELGPGRLTPVHEWERLLTSEALTQAIAGFLSQAAESTRVSTPLLPDARVTQLCDAGGIPLDRDHLAEVAAELRSLISRSLNQVLWLSNLRALLAELSELCVRGGQRPFFLIEDITAFQTVGDLLLDYLLDLTSGHFDAMIGVTTGFERTQLARATLEGDLTHIHHRLRARFVLTDESGRAYGLEEGLTEFQRAYLSAVQVDHPAPDQCTGTMPGFGHGLYPFNPTALRRRAFDCLREEGNPRQTPRLFIEHVLAQVLRSQQNRTHHPRRVNPSGPPPALFRHDEAPEGALPSILRWYGEVEDTEITVDERILDCWQIEAPAERRNGGRLRVPRTYAPHAVDTHGARPDWTEALRDLQRWLDTGGLYPTRETLKRGIQRVIFTLGDPRALRQPGLRVSLPVKEIYPYTRGDDRLPISLADDSGDVVAGDSLIKIEVSRHAEERGILEELVYLELSGSEIAQVCQNPAVTLAWAQCHRNAYHRRVQGLLAHRLHGIPADVLILVAWRLVAGLVGAPWREVPHLRSWDASEEPYSVVEPVVPLLACRMLPGRRTPYTVA